MYREWSGGAHDIGGLVEGHSARGQAVRVQASEPLRYLALVVARFVRIGEADLALPETFAASSGVERLTVAVEAQSSQRFRGRNTAQQAEEIMRFYASLIGDIPHAIHDGCPARKRPARRA